MVPSTLLPIVSVIFEKVFKTLSDFNLADFALKWTMHTHKIHSRVSAVKALVWGCTAGLVPALSIPARCRKKICSYPQSRLS